MFPEFRTLTPALSHPMGEGECKAAFDELDMLLAKSALSLPLSHRIGEGRGEGLRDVRLLFIGKRPLNDLGLFLFGAGRHGMGTSQLWDTGTLIQASVAHNAIIEFFLDCGVILTGVLLIFLLVGTVTAWRVGRRLNSDLYWALFACIFGFGLGMATEREIFPTVDNMYVFPIIAMMINLARLRYLDACHS